jgi:hypothetical protein
MLWTVEVLGLNFLQRSTCFQLAITVKAQIIPRVKSSSSSLFFEILLVMSESGLGDCVIKYQVKDNALFQFFLA